MENVCVWIQMKTTTRPCHIGVEDVEYLIKWHIVSRYRLD